MVRFMASKKLKEKHVYVALFTTSSGIVLVKVFASKSTADKWVMCRYKESCTEMTLEEWKAYFGTAAGVHKRKVAV